MARKVHRVQNSTALSTKMPLSHFPEAPAPGDPDPGLESRGAPRECHKLRHPGKPK